MTSLRQSCVQLLLFIAAYSLTVSLQAESTETMIWETSSFTDFQQGELKGVSLSSKGEISLGPALETRLTLDGQDLYVWALAEDSQGRIYAGTGEQGKIFTIAPNGDLELFFDSPEINILSLAVGQDDAVYAGSAPDGLIYKITPSGQAETFFMSGEHYVWSLVFGADNLLYAGTGESGKIFKIAPDGTGTLFYDSPQSHVMSLLYDAQGWLYAGTEGKGLVYKIDLQGKAFALYHAQEEEIHRLARDAEGNLYAAALNNSIYPKIQGSIPSEARPSDKEKMLKRSSIYRITPEGTVLKLSDLPGTLIHAMSPIKKGELLLGTDTQNALYKFSPDGTSQQLLMLKSGTSISILNSMDGSLYLGTGDGGAVYRLGPGLSTTGEYLSPVHHAPGTSNWGKIFWRGTPQQTALFTRTGNTARPDETWSGWSEALLNHEGESIPNPPARYIQWKAVLSSGEQIAPVLKEVSVAYLPRNLPPRIDEIAVYHAALLTGPTQAQITPKVVVANDAVVPSEKIISSAQPEPVNKSNLKAPTRLPDRHVSILWKAVDPNKEKLLYTISLRGEQETQWKMLKEKQAESRYLLDTSTLADGRYVVQISAVDLQNNPPDKTLETKKISEPFDVDNTPPKVSIVLRQQDAGALLLTIVAQDEYSRIKQAAYALDAGEWCSIFPDDLVTDSRDEHFSISLTDLDKGHHVLSFKATDMLGNIGVGTIRFSTPLASSTQEQGSRKRRDSIASRPATASHH
ncbi:hypothetical protein CSB45_00755 [candidate division KSB3 bacterium]|uniref:Fibronectin type-III domain-containing protein n=1 Tax=candidate division KSB3 bacterium TaxID=2044937 RepID=A0A2G6EE50_9BACT|nr:MAG: hypothetical protein CSB45_00755 [candidate division KSB3 bacterium]PIE31014.1 MAG: hypothetical protein CSA57_01465 [candidate division KSB3 bacterium]